MAVPIKRFQDLMAVLYANGYKGEAEISQGVVRLIPDPALTPPQVAQAQSFADNFDFTPRRPRPLADLITALNALTAADRNRLMVAIAAAFLQDHPGAARALGVALDGDEPDV